MLQISATGRIVIGLVFLTTSVVLAAHTFDLFPDRREAILVGRTRTCEAIAAHGSMFVAYQEVDKFEKCLEAVKARNPEILSIGVRQSDGTLLVEVGDHANHWRNVESGSAHGVFMFISLFAGESAWGRIEVRFRPVGRSGWLGLVTHPLTIFVLFVVSFSSLFFYVFLRRSLQHLDPSKVVPDRVRSALDTVTSGLLVLDDEERIVLANKAFGKTVGLDPSKLQGRRVTEFPWQSKSEMPDFPWLASLHDAKSTTGAMLGLQFAQEDQRSYLVNAAPVMGTDGKSRGVLASFEDITVLERKKWEMGQMLDVLKESRDEVRRKNAELEILATRDPLTGCMNRRSFFERFESHWAAAEKSRGLLCIAILDIDHFKSVNDTYGHSTGDKVLQEVAAALDTFIHDDHVLCRYGGEEFCVLMPGYDLYDAARITERFRLKIESLDIDGLKITSSFGVSSMALGAADPQALLDQADKCLYVAKRNGRNQVVRWDEVPDDVEVDESKVERTKPAASDADPLDGILALNGFSEEETSIPFHAVTALMSALTYRDATTADHSRRVADLCVAAASGLMSLSESYVMEIAALLHDIGKIGIPDSILLKPGQLSNDEWKIMRAHERVGAEIVSTTFNHPGLVGILENYRAYFAATPDHPHRLSGTDIPIGARLLAIADAYDAMVTERVYRSALSQEAAFEELLRCAGTQFDPDLVKRFIESVLVGDRNRSHGSGGLSKAAAVRIGSQVERLVHALDNEDIPGMAALAGRLNAIAAKTGAEEFASLACSLQAAACEQDLSATVKLTAELLELCRSAQAACLDSSAPLPGQGAT